MGVALEDQVRQALRDVIDPELGYNVVDLGLVYGVQVEDGRARIIMTMTTPGCPAAGFIEDAVYHRVREVPGIREVEVRVVWSPPWSPDMMSEEVRRRLGFA